MTKITKREMFESIIAMVATGEMSYDKDQYIDFCQKEIEQLEKKAAKAKETAAKKKAASDELTDAVRQALTDEFQPIADIVACIEGDDVTVSKVTYRLGQLAKNGEAEKQEVTIPGVEGQKSRKVMAYRAIVQ